jgi:hypothetical protein
MSREKKQHSAPSAYPSTPPKNKKIPQSRTLIRALPKGGSGSVSGGWGSEEEREKKKMTWWQTERGGGLSL